MQAIILAGGLGTRLRGILPDVPKPMAPTAGCPFLCHVLDPLCDAGFAQAVLAVGYRHEAIRSYFGDLYRKLPLRYSIETTPLGTGGALRLASRQIDPAQPFFVLNGDTCLELDYGSMLETHVRARARMTMAVYSLADVGRYGALSIEGSEVRGLLEKGGAGPGLINAGVYLFDNSLLDLMPSDGPFSFEGQLVEHLGTIRPVAFRTAGLFIDIGVPEDYARAQHLFSQAS